MTNTLSFEKNTEMLVKRAYTRMLIIRNLSAFGVPIEDMINIYILYSRSITEQSCVVWHSSLTEEQGLEIERIQKVALRIILQEKYEHYQHALFFTNLEPLCSRRKSLCLRFAQSCLKSEKNCDMFPMKIKTANLFISLFSLSLLILIEERKLQILACFY